MTEVLLGIRDGHTRFIEINGHAGFAEKGEDIICAGISAIIQSLEIGLTEVLGRSDVKIRKNPEGGFMSVCLYGPEENCAAAFMETAAQSLRAIAKSYPSYVRITEVDYNEVF